MMKKKSWQKSDDLTWNDPKQKENFCKATWY